MRNKTEIDQEIAALNALVPVGVWKRKTQNTIAIQIAALRGDYDDEDDFDALTEEEQMSAMDAIDWRDDQSDDRPSEGWGYLCA